MDQVRSEQRRTLLKGAAWSLPVISVTAASAAYAGSGGEECEEQEEVRFDALPSSLNNLHSGYAAAREEFLVPAGVTQVRFEIAGGGGGVNRNWTTNTVSHPGGDGSLITGVLSVSPGAALQLIAGNGGIGPSGTGSQSGSPGTAIKGGEGYGNGGDMPMGSASYRYAGGSGGGGSAILVNGEPVVVAGGGGGSGGGTPGGNWTWSLDAGGGNGGFTAESGTAAKGYWTARPGTVYGANGNPGADGAIPGTRPTGNPGGSSGWVGDGSNGAGLAYGNEGGAPSAEGGHGAAGRTSYAVQDTYGVYAYTSGGGGGGYAGGASGDAYAVVYSEFAAAMGGGGGGGSSYVAPAAVGGVEVAEYVSGTAGNGAHPALQRNPGWIKLTYNAC